MPTQLIEAAGTDRVVALDVHNASSIDNAFRIYMLPQGLFSVAVATVLFPTLSRMASRRDAAGMRRAVGIGMRQINLLLIPAAAFMLAVLVTTSSAFAASAGFASFFSSAIVLLLPSLNA